MTAREIIYRMLETYHVSNSDFRMVHAGEKAVEAAMIEFAREKVKEALETASENAEAVIEYGSGDWMLAMSVERSYVDKESILNAYSIENIK